jgi:hypothetical protein
VDRRKMAQCSVTKRRRASWICSRPWSAARGAFGLTRGRAKRVERTERRASRFAAEGAGRSTERAMVRRTATAGIREHTFSFTERGVCVEGMWRLQVAIVIASVSADAEATAEATAEDRKVALELHLLQRRAASAEGSIRLQFFRAITEAGGAETEATAPAPAPADPSVSASASALCRTQ